MLIYALLLGWITFVIIAASTSNWVIEQGNFSGEVSLPNIRWLIMLVEALVILVPCLVLAWVLKTNPVSAPLRAWALGGLFVLLLFPSYFTFISDFQLTLLIKWVGMGLYLLALLGWRTLAKIKLPAPGWNGMWLALLCGGRLFPGCLTAHWVP
jgi:hypothetical protein